MDLDGLKDKLEEAVEVVDSFLDHFASKVGLGALVLVLVGLLVFDGVALVVGNRGRLSPAERAIAQARVLSASGEYEEAIERLMSVRRKKMTKEVEKRLISELLRNERLLEQGEVAGAETNFRR